MKNNFLKSISIRRLLIIAVFLMPAIVYIFQAYGLRNWIVDDAGISFAFSRNVANGAGFVSQPGVEPVECYSNFSWVVFFVPFFKINLFELTLTPKLFSLLLVFATYFLIFKIIKEIFIYKIPATLFVLILLSMSTPFLVWTSSGLENPLYVFLIVLLAWLCMKFFNEFDQQKVKWAILSSIAAAGIGLTRPEGVLYFSAFPIIWAVCGLKTVFFTKLRMRQLGLYFLGIILIFGSFIIFRYLTFGDWFPNTFYAKGGPTLATIIGYIFLNPGLYERIHELFSAVANRYSGWLIAFILFSGIFLGAKKQLGGKIIIILFMGLSALSYILLPKDWMKEFRFATPFFPFFYLVMFAFLECFCDLLPHFKRIHQIAFVTLAVLFLVFSLKIYIPRTTTFINQPTVPIEDVKINFGEKFNYYADLLELKSGSFLVPDLGGTLFVSRLRIYDLVGLCDKQIAKTIGKNQPAFYQYIFEDTRPTFIHIHWPWNIVANLDGDPRFRLDYVTISEEKDANGKVLSGDYIRADAISGKEHLLDKIRQ